MKKISLISIFLTPLLLLIVSPSFASTGQATSEVNVNTNVSGSSTNESTSNIHTHIEVETNGEKKVLDEYGPGNYSVTSNSDNGGESSVHVTNNAGDDEINDDSQNNSTKSAEEKEEEEINPKTPVTLIKDLFEGIGGFVLRFFRNL